MPYGTKHHMPFVLFSSFTAALAGLLFGMDTGIISGALPFISIEMGLSPIEQGWVVSVLMFGAAIGAISSSFLSWSLGRKVSLLLAAYLFVIGSVLSGFASGIVVLMFGRAILGLAIGVASFTAPLYLSEIAPGCSRGRIISLYQLMITIGILLAFLSDTVFSYAGAWRWMLSVPVIPTVILLCAVFFLPNSPRWLVMRGRYEEAGHVLSRLRSTPEEADRERDDIRASLTVPQEGWSLFRNNTHFRRTVGLGMLLQVMQQLTGINVIMYYAPIIFGVAGFASTEQQMWGTVAVGLVNVLATFIAIGLVDRWGRRPILQLGFLVMGLGMGLLGGIIYLDLHNTAAHLFAVAMVLVFVTGFAMSAGPVVWVLCSEIQPLKGRDFGIMCSTGINWIANMCIGATFLSLLNGVGGPLTFGLFAALNLLFIVLTTVFVPETRGVSLEHIEKSLMAGKPLRHLGR